MLGDDFGNPNVSKGNSENPNMGGGSGEPDVKGLTLRTLM